jgi:hypothetical protein
LSYLTTKVGDQDLPGQSAVVKWFAANPLWVLALLVLPGLLSLAIDIFESWCSKATAETNIDSDEFALVLTSIEEVVAKKRTAISQVANDARIAASKPGRRETLERLIRPEDQIQECVSQLYNCFRAISGDMELKVALVPIVNGAPVRAGAIFHPISSAPSMELFEEANAKKTMFAYVARSHQPEFIADLGAYFHRNSKSRRTYLFMREEVDNGSILCMPIVDPTTGKAVYALSILTSEPEFFRKQTVKKFSGIAEYFGTRILMEYGLKLILTHTDDR